MYIVLEEQNDGTYLSVPNILEDSAKAAVATAKASLGHGNYTVAKMMAKLTLAPPKREADTVATVETLNPRKQNGAE